MTTVSIFAHAGSFAENKDIARALRLEYIEPALAQEHGVILDFSDVVDTTQSFVHALISEVIRRKGFNVIDDIFFRNCNETVQAIITIVVDYMQEGVMYAPPGL